MYVDKAKLEKLYEKIEDANDQIRIIMNGLDEILDLDDDDDDIEETLDEEVFDSEEVLETEETLDTEEYL